MEQIINYDNTQMYRLQCRCLSKEHAIDLDLSLNSEHYPYICADYVKLSWMSWRERLSYIWRILLGLEVKLNDFTFREEDFQPLAELFADLADHYSNTVKDATDQ